MRTCTVCTIAKDESEFFFRSKAAGKLHSQCKKCYSLKRKIIWEEYYQQHGDTYRSKALLRSRKQKSILRAKMLDYLNDKCCIKCGIADNRVLDFDHIDPGQKSFSIARALSDKYSWQKIMKEFEKCQILCANCHKIKTADEQGWYRL